MTICKGQLYSCLWGEPEQRAVLLVIDVTPERISYFVSETSTNTVHDSIHFRHPLTFNAWIENARQPSEASYLPRIELMSDDSALR